MTRFIALVACVALLALAAPALAGDPKPGAGDGKGGHPGKPQGHGKGDAHFQICQADYEKYCKDAKPGGGSIMGCMRGHMDRLTPACAKVITDKAQHEDKMRAKHKEKAADFREKAAEHRDKK